MSDAARLRLVMCSARVAPRNTIRMLLRMIMPTSNRLSWRANDAISSVLNSTEDTRDSSVARRCVIRSVVDDDCRVRRNKTLYSDWRGHKT